MPIHYRFMTIGIIAMLCWYLPACATHPAKQTASSCNLSPSDPEAQPSTQRIYRYLQELSCDKIAGVLSGQNAGHGNQIVDYQHAMSYQALITPVARATGKIPFILGIDYEHDAVFSLSELLTANKPLIAHANRGGIVTINWSPISPWLTAGDNNWQATRVASHKNANITIHLGDLLNADSNLNKIWLMKLDVIAQALDNLQQAGVTVLWRPMQEMNGDWFWWGQTQPFEDPAEYIAVWRHMHNYFSKDKKLHNLLWVYSPNKTTFLAKRDALWAYPGDDVVDILAGTLYDNSLKISDYDRYSQTGKPLGIAEYGPAIGNRRHFDNTLYAKRLLKDYPKIAYWVSWHSYPATGNEWEKLALKDNRNLIELFNNPLIISLSFNQDK